MPPLFACFPVCLTFVAIGIVAAIVVAFGMYNRLPQEEEAAAEATPATGLPPLWVFPAVLVLAILAMLLLGWYWPE